tara:strand:+ start:584 stop:985 length:402 start_codon:yes stop_codon:yes gene_type:complete
MIFFYKLLVGLIIGSIVGFVGGLQGIAGGFYISMLLLLSGVSQTQRQAAGTTLLAILFPISIGAVYEYWKTGDIDIYLALTITVFYTIFAWIGAKINPKIDPNDLFLSLAFLLFFTSFYFLYKYLHGKKFIKW